MRLKPFFIKKSILFLLFFARLELLKADQAEQNVDENFKNPYSHYAEFQRINNEEEDALFNQFGRYCGVNLGLGTSFLTGNRALLWQGGFPTFTFDTFYWFNFNFALGIGLMSASYFFNTPILSQNYVSINIFSIGLTLRYYISTQNLSAPVSFSGPYVSISGSGYTKTESSSSLQNSTSLSAVGFTLGGGFEFPLKPQSSYCDIETKVHFVTFADSNTSIYQSVGIPNLTGLLISVTGSILFTW